MIEHMEQPKLKETMFPEFFEEKRKIEGIVEKMSKKAEERLEGSSGLVDPAKMFKEFVEIKIEQAGLDIKPKEYLAYHMSISSSPDGSEKYFDTEDGLFLKSLEEFSQYF
jgi:hypothetical protein